MPHNRGFFPITYADPYTAHLAGEQIHDSDDMDGINARRHGISSKAALAPRIVKSSDRDTRALAAHGKRQRLSVSFAYRISGFPDERTEKVWIHLCHCILLGSPHVMGGNCRVSKKLSVLVAV